MRNHLHIIAHRGASAYCVDNSIESISKAVNMGSKIIEIDVRLTKDLKLVLAHDDFYVIDDIEKNIKNSLLSELGNIVELNDILTNTREYIIFYLDIKCDNDEIIIAEKINNILKNFPNRLFYIASFSDTFVSLFKSIYTNYKLGIIFQIFNKNIYNILKHKIKFVVSQITQTKEFERFLEIKNKTKYVYTINNLSLIDNYYSYIDGIVTDYPDIMSLK